MSLFEAQALTIRYASGRGEDLPPAVNNLNFTLNKGETLALVGESGSGKTTTGHALLGLLPETAQITAKILRFDHYDLQSLSASDRRQLRGGGMAMVFQDALSALNPLMTVGQQISEAVRLHQRLSRRDAKARAVALLEQVRIPHPLQRFNAWPHQLSGGMRQRVVIAMALAGNPSMLIADEPTTALDVTLQAEIIRLLATIQQETGTAILLVTHDLGVVAELADRVMVMRHGECVESADAGTIFRNPQHPYTRQLMAARPVPGGYQ